jgi:Mn2+/Fe2+ NRAMP family transporter
LIVANALNIAADLVAVGSGMTLLHAGPTWMWALVAGLVITALVTLGSFARVAQIFKFLCLALFTYFAVLFSVQVNWGNVGLHTVVPHLTFSSTGLPRVSRTVGPRKVRVQPEASSGAWLHHEGSSIRSSRTSCVVK